MQHFLSSRQGVDIPVKHLFVEYKFWISKEQPFQTVREELETLSRQGEEFRRIIAPSKDDHLRPLMLFMDAFDIRTAYPLLLFLLDAKLLETDWDDIATILESYLLRRAVCGRSTKNYFSSDHQSASKGWCKRTPLEGNSARFQRGVYRVAK
jgi:hypothetical protein